MEHYKFCQNRECEYFPCHTGIDPEEFNCLFCYCPLYALAEDCGGSFRYTEDGIKDCSGCLRPHRRDSFHRLLPQMGKLLELAKKKENPPDRP